jgi:histone acetyltransferase (RNA polymerase elongator complex component)
MTILAEYKALFLSDTHLLSLPYHIIELPLDYFCQMHHYTIPIFVPELACPHRCIFCNQQKISGTFSQPEPDEVAKIIESRIATMAAGSEIEVGFFGGNFTGISQQLQETYLSLVQPYIRSGIVKSIRLSTRPDYITVENLEFLKQFHVGTIELGAQSLSDEVLEKSGRGHTAEQVQKASMLIKEHNFNLGLQMMLGLPGDSREMSVFTAHEIVKLGASNTRIYPTLVIRNTKLEELWRKSQYVPLTLEQAIEQTAEIVRIFEEHDIKILRLGLHPSEGLLNGQDLLAGPFHPAFGELVHSFIWNENVRERLREIPNLERHANGGRCKRLIVEVPAGQVNAAVGHSSINKQLLLLHFREVKFRGSSQLTGRQFVFNME